MPIQVAGWDTYVTVLNDTPVPIHLYHLNDNILRNNKYALAPFTQAGQTMQFIFTPYLDETDLDLYNIPFDNKFYGQLSDDKGQPLPQVNVYKIKGLAGKEFKNLYSKEKELKNSIPIYKTYNRQKDRKHWSNESKLYQAPYSYMMLQDYANTPLALAPHLFSARQRETNKFSVKVRVGITMAGGHILFVPGYKGDDLGLVEGMVCETGNDLPVSSTMYNNWYARNKSQTIANVKMGLAHGTIDVIDGGLNAMLGIATAGVGAYRQEITTYDKMMRGAYNDPAMGRDASWTWLNRRDLAMGEFITNPHINYGSHNAIGGMRNMAHGYLNSITNAYQLNAQMEDMIHAPRNVQMASADALFSFVKSNKELALYRYDIHEYYKEKLCDFWTLYGYKQRKLLKLSWEALKRRKYFTYIKTVNVNIKGNEMDKTELDAVKDIFNNGIRFWRYFTLNQDGLEMYDYSKDNVEV